MEDGGHITKELASLLTLVDIYKAVGYPGIPPFDPEFAYSFPARLTRFRNDSSRLAVSVYVPGPSQFGDIVHVETRVRYGAGDNETRSSEAILVALTWTHHFLLTEQDFKSCLRLNDDHFCSLNDIETSSDPVSKCGADLFAGSSGGESDNLCEEFLGLTEWSVVQSGDGSYRLRLNSSLSFSLVCVNGTHRQEEMESTLTSIRVEPGCVITTEHFSLPSAVYLKEEGHDGPLERLGLFMPWDWKKINVVNKTSTAEESKEVIVVSGEGSMALLSVVLLWLAGLTGYLVWKAIAKRRNSFAEASGFRLSSLLGNVTNGD